MFLFRRREFGTVYEAPLSAVRRSEAPLTSSYCGMGLDGARLLHPLVHARDSWIGPVARIQHAGSPRLALPLLASEIHPAYRTVRLAGGRAKASNTVQP